MKKFKKYEAILDDGKFLFKVHTIAPNKKAVEEFCQGNGEIIQIKEVPEYLPNASRVREALKKDNFGDAEADMIYRLLYMYVEGTEPNADY